MSYKRKEKREVYDSFKTWWPIVLPLALTVGTVVYAGKKAYKFYQGKLKTNKMPENGLEKDIKDPSKPKL